MQRDRFRLRRHDGIANAAAAAWLLSFASRVRRHADLRLHMRPRFHLLVQHWLQTHYIRPSRAVRVRLTSSGLVLLAALLAGVPVLMYWQGAWTLLRGSTLQDPLRLLIAKAPGKARVLAACGGLLALVILAQVGVSLAQAPWGLSARSAMTMSSGGKCDLAGARYAIQVNGGSYTCGGGDTKCPREAVRIAYDPHNPNHCRVASNMGRPSLYELHAILFAVAWLCFGGAVATWRSDAETTRSSAGHRAFFALLCLTLAAMLVSVEVYSAA